MSDKAVGIAKIIQDAMSGKKTHITAALMVAMGVMAIIDPQAATFGQPNPMSQVEAMQMILQGLGFSTVRAGITKSGPSA